MLSFFSFSTEYKENKWIIAIVFWALQLAGLVYSKKYKMNKSHFWYEILQVSILFILESKDLHNEQYFFS